MRAFVDKVAGIEGGRTGFDRRDLVLIVLAVLLATAIRLVFLRGVSSPDELNYLRDAGECLRGRFELKNALYLHDTRHLMFVPVAWSFAALGVSEVTALLWPFLASLAVVVIVYLIALRLFGRETAVYTVFCAALLPLLVQEATRLLPGVVMNLLFGLCALCFVISEQVSRRRWIWLTLSGLFYAVIQTAGELGIVLGCLFVAAVIFWRRYRLWTYWPAAAGFAVVTALIGAYFWIETGTPLFKVEMSRKLVVLIKAVSPHQPLYYTKLILAPFIAHGGVFYMTGIGCVAGLLEKRREALFVGAWFVMTWVLMEFGSVSFSEYRQLSKEVRYFSVVSVPAVIAAGYAMAWIRGVVGRRTIACHRVLPAGAVVGACVLVASMSVWTLQRHADMSAYQANRRKLGDYVRSYEGKPIYVTHCRWNTEVGFFMRFEEEYFPSGYDPYHAVRLETADSTSMNRYVQTLTAGERIGPGLLVQDERLFRASRGEAEDRGVGLNEIPGVLAHIPSAWRLIERMEVSVGQEVSLYDIPDGATWPAGVQR